MFRAFSLLILAAGLLGAATIRLYMKDGTYHSVREYENKGDRMRYYSTERSEWEEDPARPRGPEAYRKREGRTNEAAAA